MTHITLGWKEKKRSWKDSFVLDGKKPRGWMRWIKGRHITPHVPGGHFPLPKSEKNEKLAFHVREVLPPILTVRRVFFLTLCFAIVIVFWLTWAGYLAVAGLNLLAQRSDRTSPDIVLYCVYCHKLTLLVSWHQVLHTIRTYPIRYLS